MGPNLEKKWTANETIKRGNPKFCNKNTYKLYYWQSFKQFKHFKHVIYKIIDNYLLYTIKLMPTFRSKDILKKRFLLNRGWWEREKSFFFQKWLNSHFS